MEAREFLTNRDAMEVSALWKAARKIEPSIIHENAERLNSSYKLSDCRKMSQEAWGVVFGAILRQDAGFEKYALLPPDISTSPTCMGIILENEHIFKLVIERKLGYNGIIRLALQKGIWAR